MTSTEFELLARQLRPTILSVGKRFFNSDDDAEDVAQETLVRLWKYAEKLDSGLLKEALAVKVAKSVCVDFYRKRKAEQAETPWPQTPLHPTSSAGPSPHEQLVAKEMEQLMGRVLAQLPPRERSLFEMRQIEGLSNDEIALRTGITKASVKAIVSATRRKLFEQLSSLVDVDKHRKNREKNP